MNFFTITDFVFFLLWTMSQCLLTTERTILLRYVHASALVQLWVFYYWISPYLSFLLSWVVSTSGLHYNLVSASSPCIKFSHLSFFPHILAVLFNLLVIYSLLPSAELSSEVPVFGENVCSIFWPLVDISQHFIMATFSLTIVLHPLLWGPLHPQVQEAKVARQR